MFAAALAVGRVGVSRLLYWRHQRPSSLPPVPAAWTAMLHRYVPLSRRLSEQQQQRLLQKTQRLIEGCRWEGCAGLEITEEIRFTIAAQACLLVLEHDGDPYPGLETVLVYPGTFRPRRFSWTPAADAENGIPTLGESWKHGVVILAWDSAAAGVANPADGNNVVVHEFAHQLDSASGGADGVPRLRLSAYTPWAAMLEQEFTRLVDEAIVGHQGVLDHYGATAPAEFFAVATEAFFERPAELQRERPALYDALRAYYAQDPVAQEAGAAGPLHQTIVP